MLLNGKNNDASVFSSSQHLACSCLWRRLKPTLRKCALWGEDGVEGGVGGAIPL